MANYKGTRLMKDELWSMSFPGYIEKTKGIYRKPRMWTDKNGVNRCVNTYFILKNCCICNVKMLQEKSNSATGGNPVCSPACKKKLVEAPEGRKKFKRATSDSHILVKSTFHPHKDRFGFVPEHRLVVEKNLERFLKKTEIVHHINLVKTDNRLENLVVFKSSKEHFLSHGSLNKCVKKLMEIGCLEYDTTTNEYKVGNHYEKNFGN